MATKQAKRRGAGQSPLERTRDAVHEMNAPDGTVATSAAPPDVPQPIIDLEDLGTPDLVYNRERAYCVSLSMRFEKWMVQLVADHRIPMDCALRGVEILTIYVEAMLLARVTWPWMFPEYEVGSDEDADYAPRTEGEAMAAGLSVRTARRKKKAVKLAPTLPGCRGTDDNGAPCQELRHVGASYCPTCEAHVRRELRSR